MDESYKVRPSNRVGRIRSAKDPVWPEFCLNLGEKMVTTGCRNSHCAVVRDIRVKLRGGVMVYNEILEARIKKIVSRWKKTDSKKMFGGMCHLLNGNMFCGVYEDFLILRLGDKISKEALGLSFVKPFDITGRPMKGWVMVGKEGLGNDNELNAWLNKAKAFVRSLPAK